MRHELIVAQLRNIQSNKLDFYSLEDTQNFQSENRNLCTAIVIKKSYYNISNIIFNLLDNNDTLVGLDIETTGLDLYKDEIVGIGIALKDKQFYIPIYPEIIEIVINQLNELNHYVVWVLHNAKFDLKFLYYKHGFIAKNFIDTIVLHYLIDKPPHKLSVLAQNYLGRYPLTFEELIQPYNKNILQVPLQKVANYCAEDALESLLLYPIFKNILECRNKKFKNLAYTDTLLIFVIMAMELRGIIIDKDKAKDLVIDLKNLEKIIESEFRFHTGYKGSMTSPPQLSVLFYEKLQLPTTNSKKGKTGYSVNESSLSFLIDEHIGVSLLIEYRKLIKARTVFCSKLPNMADKDSRIHSNFNYTGTVTGRLSSSDPNLQNIPNPAKTEVGKLIRSLFVPTQGFKFIDVDYSQFELRILAHYTKCPYLVNAFNNSLDLHSELTKLVFNIPEIDKNNPVHIKWRTLCKNINFGIIYMMGLEKFYKMATAYKTRLTRDDCIKILGKLAKVTREIDDYRIACAFRAIINGYTETLWGRRRYYEFYHPYLKALYNTNVETSKEHLNFLNSKGYITQPDWHVIRQAINFPIQGTNADVIRAAMVSWYKREPELFGKPFLEDFDNRDCYLLLQIHDELVFECKENKINVYSEEIKDIMIKQIQLDIPVEVSLSICNNWGDGK